MFGSAPPEPRRKLLEAEADLAESECWLCLLGSYSRREERNSASHFDLKGDTIIFLPFLSESEFSFGPFFRQLYLGTTVFWS